MSNLIPMRGQLSTNRPDRALGRHLTAIARTNEVALARLEAAAQLEAARAHATGYVGQQAMHAVTMLSQLEGQLGQLCPLAVTRLQGLADMTALSVAQVVADAPRRLS